MKPIPYGGPFPPTVSSDLDTGNVTSCFLFLLILPQHSLGKGMVADEELPPGLNQARGPATHSLPPDASGCRYRRVLCGAGGTILFTLTRSFAPTGPQGEISYRKVGGRAEGQTERAMSPAETLEEVRADCRARQRGRERRGAEGGGAEGGCGLACEETLAFSSCLKSLEVFND